MDVRTAADARVVCGMTTASRATALLTAACRIASEKLAADLTNAGEPPSVAAESESGGTALANLAGREYHGEYVCDFTTKPGADVADPITHMTFSYATQVVILDDDGRLERVVAAHDVGRAINPVLCAGQIEGGVHMGLGYALSEDFPCTDGVPDSLLLRDLGILKAKDTPADRCHPRGGPRRGRRIRLQGGWRDRARADGRRRGRVRCTAYDGIRRFASAQ